MTLDVLRLELATAVHYLETAKLAALINRRPHDPWPAIWGHRVADLKRRIAAREARE